MAFSQEQFGPGDCCLQSLVYSKNAKRACMLLGQMVLEKKSSKKAVKFFSEQPFLVCEQLLKSFYYMEKSLVLLRAAVLNCMAMAVRVTSEEPRYARTSLNCLWSDLMTCKVRWAKQIVYSAARWKKASP